LAMRRRSSSSCSRSSHGRRVMLSNRSLAESATAQIELSKAEATLAGGRAFLLESVSEAWEQAQAGERISTEARVRMRMAAVHAVECAVRATDAAYTVSGGSAVFTSSPLQRCLRDVHTATQHLMVSPRLHETFGRFLLGQQADTAML
jgi:indole-3-acetate monooxygenase